MNAAHLRYDGDVGDNDCDCDTCEGFRFTSRHVPDECLFDDMDVNHRYRDGLRRNLTGMHA